MSHNAFSNRRSSIAGKARKPRHHLIALIGALLLIRTAATLHAGGGGENMLLIVNPNDEPSLRIANAYVQARHIPVCNILYIAPPTLLGFTSFAISEAQFASTYQSVIPNAIAARGLTNQIDYIGTLGQPHVVTPDWICIHNCLNQLTQLQNGMPISSVTSRFSELFFPQNTAVFNYTHGTNSAIHHSTHYTPVGASGTASYVQWYLSGMIGYAGHQGLTTTQVIQNLQRTVAGDGAKPAGTIYFEKSNDDARTGTRSPYWPPVQQYLTLNNVPWIQESLNNGATAVPTNRRDVYGAEIGSQSYAVPNGSIYLPGSWADNLTSFGCVYGSFGGQTLASSILLAGGGGSSGTITEPFADPNRFPMTSLSIFSYDGSTLGEAYYKTVYTPDLIMFQGDLLSQAYADIPTVVFTSAPADGATISGSLSLSGSAFLPNLTNQSTATGIANLRLFLDGTDTGSSVSAASGTFAVNTTSLTDGIHEVRLVACNNSAAASEGCAIRNFLVNNQGESVSITGTSNYNVAASQVFSIPVAASQGSGPGITGIQLQSLGRVVGSIAGVSGNVALSGTSLAYGVNTITPVALLSGGQQVQGQSIRVTRRFQPLTGTSSTPLAIRNPGFDFFYYPGVAQKTMAATNFSGTPAYVIHSNTLQITPSVPTNPFILNMPAAYRTSAGGSNVGLAVMAKSAFTVTTPGEYSFSFTGGSSANSEWTSVSISVDGVTVLAYDCWSGNTLNLFSGNQDTLSSVCLLPGEHTLTVKLANYPSNGTSTADSNLSFPLQFRGLDANLRGIKNTASTYLAANFYNTEGYAFGPYFYTVTKNTGH